MDGTPVKNLLDIPKDAKVLIATDQNDYVGVEFEDVQLTELNKKLSLVDLTKEKSSKFSNTEIRPKPELLLRPNLKFFPSKRSVGVRNTIAPDGQTSKFVPKP